MRTLIAVALLFFLMSSVADADNKAVQRAFENTMYYATGALMCETYVGDADLRAARELMRRVWVTGGESGDRLETLVSKWEEMAVDQIGNRSLADMLPGVASAGDKALACRQVLDGARAAAEDAVNVLEQVQQ